MALSWSEGMDSPLAVEVEIPVECSNAIYEQRRREPQSRTPALSDRRA
jgi:hypothetical protein